MRIREEVAIFWNELTSTQKCVVIAIALFILAIVLTGFTGWLSSYRETRRLERDVTLAQIDAKEAQQQVADALAKAADIAKQKLAVDRQLKEVEIQRDAKVTQVEQAEIDTIDARVEYIRTIREHRPEVPDIDHLCFELATLGYPCK